MQFNYKDEHKGDPIAVITHMGNLMFAPVKSQPNRECVTICYDGEHHADGVWRPKEVKKKFYKGDSITITF